MTAAGLRIVIITKATNYPIAYIVSFIFLHQVFHKELREGAYKVVDVNMTFLMRGIRTVPHQDATRLIFLS